MFFMQANQYTLKGRSVFSFKENHLNIAQKRSLIEKKEKRLFNRKAKQVLQHNRSLNKTGVSKKKDHHMKDCTLDDMEKDDGLVFLEGTSEEVMCQTKKTILVTMTVTLTLRTVLNDTYGDSCCADQDEESRDKRMESYSALQAEIGTQTDMNGFVQVGTQTDASESVQVHTVPAPVSIPSICYVPFQSRNKSKPYGTNIIQDEATKFYTVLASWALFQFLLGFLVDKYPNYTFIV